MIVERFRVVAACALWLCAGCTTSKSSGTTDDGGHANADAASSMPCTGTLYGPVTGTFRCNVDAVFDRASGESRITIVPLSMPSGVTQLTAMTTFSGELVSRMYAARDATVYGGTVTKNGATYSASETTEGSALAIQLTSVRAFEVPAGSAYELHGTFDVTMPDATNADSVQMALTF